MGCSAKKYLTLPLVSLIHLHASFLICKQNCNPSDIINQPEIESRTRQTAMPLNGKRKASAQFPHLWEELPGLSELGHSWI